MIFFVQRLNREQHRLDESPVYWVKADSATDACKKLDLRVEGDMTTDEWQSFERKTGMEIELIAFDGVRGEISSPEELYKLAVKNLL